MKQHLKRILILDDDYQLSKTLRTLITNKLNVEVEWTDDVERCLSLIDESHYDLLIVDWILKNNETGLEVVNYAKEYFYQTKVLMLTCQQQVHNRLKAYKTGADAYLAKPFNSDELLHIINQLLHQYKLHDTEAIEFAGIVLYPKSGKLLINDNAVNIRSKEVKILQQLLINKSRVLSKDQLISLVWPNFNKQPGLNTVEVYIRRLRQKLGPFGYYLKNKRGFGYYFSKGNEQ